MRYLFGSLYILIYTIYAFSFVPLDNFDRWGTYVFLSPLLTILVFVPLLHYLEKFEKPENQKLFIFAILGHYLVTVILVILQLSGHRARALTLFMFQEYPRSFCFTIAFYVAGQIIIWLRLWMVKKDAIE